MGEAETLLPQDDESPTGKPTSQQQGALARWSVGDWITTAIILAAGFYVDEMPPFERDIRPQLHDPDIAYPHTPPDKQQVPSWLLWRLTLYAPLAILLPAALSAPRGVSALRLLNEMALGLYSSVGSTLLLVCIVKVMVGRMRPDFIARCKPVDGVCTGAAKAVLEGRKSFPSGHTGLSFAGLGYASLVLFARLASCDTPRMGLMWKYAVALLPWTMALLVGLSRIEDYWCVAMHICFSCSICMCMLTIPSDPVLLALLRRRSFRHHWSDVLVGGAIGNACAYAAFRLRFPMRPDGGGVGGGGGVDGTEMQASLVLLAPGPRSARAAIHAPDGNKARLSPPDAV